MISRFNATGRKRIQRADAHVTISPADDGNPSSAGGGTGSRGASGTPDGEWRVDLDLRLGRYGFPDDAEIRVEAWRGQTFQRWSWGTVGRQVRPDPDARVLRDVPETSMFKVAVVAAGGSGRLLGLADRLRPELPVKSLLPMVAADLKGDLWRLSFVGRRRSGRRCAACRPLDQRCRLCVRNRLGRRHRGVPPKPSAPVTVP